MKPLWWMKLHYRFHGAGGEHTEWVYCGTWKPTQSVMEEVAQSKAEASCGPGGWTCTETAVPHSEVPMEIVHRKIREVGSEVEAGMKTLRELRGEG